MKKYYFKETLNKAKEYGIEVLDLDIANEVSCTLTVDVNDDTFEKICKLIRRAYLKTEYISINDFCLCIDNLITNGELAIEDISSYYISDLIEQASYYC